jgi:hypothetical protein
MAAELTGLHPQTLRIYERERLLDPVRSAGGRAGTAPMTLTGCNRSGRSPRMG